MKTNIILSQHDTINNENLDDILNISNLTIGMILNDKYEIIREIAKGGMGVVYEAYDHYIHRQVAIKSILGNKIDARSFKRFQKEIEAYARLSHPNVIKIYDAGIYENNPYIVMEYIDGIDICQYIAQHDEAYGQKNNSGIGKKRNWKLCARLIYETALGLEYIHNQKMFHRDIKPTNILVRSNGSPVIIDLGVVKFNQERSYNLTRSRDIIGTYQYMPIEQTKGKRGKIDARTDVYSLGLILYELLTEQRAYTGKDITEILNKINTYYPPLPREINSHIPTVLEQITMHAIEKKKDNRYSSAKEFADALDSYLNGTPAKKHEHKKNNKNVLVYAILFLIIAIISSMTIYNLKHTSHLGYEKDKIKLPNDPEQHEALLIKQQLEIAFQYYNQKKFDEAFQIFQELSKQENEKAQFQLAQMVQNGQGTEKNINKAKLLYEQVANKGNIEAQFLLGSIYFNYQFQYGKEEPKDIGKAIYWFEKAASQGYSEAQFHLGVIYFNDYSPKFPQNFLKAFYWFEKASNQGNPKAQYHLGILYYKGQGVKQDIEKAIFWFEKATSQGYSEAQFHLGVLYSNPGEHQDIGKAIFWFEKAASQNHANAQYLLGVLYNNQGKHQDFEKAIYWFEKAASQNHANAQYHLGVLYSNQGEHQDFEKAIYWLEKALNQGYQDAKQKLLQTQYNLGNMYYNGEYIPKDLAKAVYWYEKTANQGYQDAQLTLGDMYYNGEYIPKDLAKAVYWYEKAANQNYTEAQFNLGRMYYTGQGVKQDLKKARDLFEKAANLGHKASMIAVGRMYSLSQGGKRDMKKANYWFNKYKSNEKENEIKENE